jgi:CHAT domain-containing protein
MKGPSSPTRRRLLGFAIAAGLRPAGAVELTQVYALQPLLARYVNAAMYDLKAGRYADAAARLAIANALVDEDPDSRWPYRCYVQPPYALALVKQGRALQAVTLLQQTFAARDRIVNERAPRFFDVLHAIDERLGLELMRVEYGREIMSSVVTRAAIGTGRDLADDTGPGESDVWLVMARALDQAGARDQLLRWYAERVVPMGFDHGNPPQLVAREYRLHAYARALANADALPQAYDAWALARAANVNRLDRTMREGAPHAVFAACTFRRVLLSAGVLASQADGQLEQRQRELLCEVMVTKGAGILYAQRLRNAIETTAPESAERLEALEDQLAQLSPKTTDPRPFLQLMAQHDLLSGAAARALPPVRGGFAAPTADLSAQLQRRLGDSTLVGFMLVTGWADRAGETEERRYLRYCVSAKTIQLRVLGAQGPIDRLVHACRTAFLQGVVAPVAASALASALLAELPHDIAAAQEWIIDPDGALHLLPFDALPGRDGRPLVCTHGVRTVTTLRRLLEPLATIAPGGSALVLADPDYTSGVSGGNALRGLRLSADRMPLGVVPALPETRAEARAVARSLARLGIRSDIHEGRAATAQTLQNARAPLVLHVAAHAALRPALDEDRPQLASEDAVDLLLPGRQAALVLSHAGRPAAFLAKDVARLALAGTALVVLSACNTANGDVLPGEGVASLRRATETAGARSTIAAVWQVPSAATTDLMTAFYGYLAGGQTIGSALRAAKLDAYRRGTPPQAWAAFQLSGDDGTLTAIGA